MKCKTPQEIVCYDVGFKEGAMTATAKYQAVVDAAREMWEQVEEWAERQAIEAGLGVSEWEAMCTGREWALHNALDALDKEGGKT